jgi:chromosome segregation ATPase
MQDTQGLDVEAPVQQEANGIAGEIIELVGFLRRFASMVTGGDNAAKLHGAANLIEDLVDALDRERKESHDVEARLNQIVSDAEARLDQNVRAHAIAQAEIDSARTELSALQDEMSEQKRRADAAHESVFNEAQVQSLRADAAERRLRETTDELTKLQASMGEIGKNLVVLPVSTMAALRGQFEFLGRQFGLAGDATSQAMCEVGACTIAEAVEDRLRQTDTVTGPTLASGL